jgi:hypothetical protein
LRKDFIEPMGISRYRVAKNINVPQRRIDLICRGDAGLTPKRSPACEHQARLGRDGHRGVPITSKYFPIEK